MPAWVRLSLEAIRRFEPGRASMPNTSGLNRTLGSAIGVIALVSVLSSGAVLITGNQLRDATDARNRSSQLIRGLDNFRTAMLNQETGLRGYLLTGREASLEPYRAGRFGFGRGHQQPQRYDRQRCGAHTTPGRRRVGGSQLADRYRRGCGPKGSGSDDAS